MAKRMSYYTTRLFFIAIIRRILQFPCRIYFGLSTQWPSGFLLAINRTYKKYFAGHRVQDIFWEDGQRIEFFSGNSSNSGLTSSLPDSTENTSATTFRLETSEWDDVNDCFKHSFRKIKQTPDITVDSDTCSLINNYFQVIWTGLPLSTRSQWLADSTYTGSTILRTLTVVLPSIEIQGVTILNQLDIRTSHVPQL